MNGKARVLVGLCSVALMLLLVGPPWPATSAGEPLTPSPTKPDGAAKAAEAFESIYGADVRNVKATKDAKDDLDLASRLLVAARGLRDQPEFLAVICQKAYELALTRPEGYQAAIDAMEILALAIPERATEAVNNITLVRQKQFEIAKVNERESARELLVETLIRACRTMAADGMSAEASVAWRKAQAHAQSLQGPRKAELGERVKDLAAVVQAASAIQELKKQFDADRQNADVRMKIVRLYLVEFDDPAEAAKYLEGMTDELLCKYVPAATKPVESAPAQACIEMADWYRGLADSASPGAKAAMLVRARAYYQRYLELHANQDADRARAVMASDKVEADLKRLRGAGAGQTPAWIDLLALADPVRDSVKGAWERQGSRLATAATSTQRDRLLAFPVAIQGSYELQVVLSRTSGNDVFGLVLPVGTASVSFGLGWFGQRGSGFFTVNGKYPHESENSACVRPGPVQQNREYTLHLRVVLRDDKAHISASMEGKPFVLWEGPQASLGAWDAWTSPKDRVAIASRGADIVVSAARLRLISGQATPVRRASQP